MAKGRAPSGALPGQIINTFTNFLGANLLAGNYVFLSAINISFDNLERGKLYEKFEIFYTTSLFLGTLLYGYRFC